MLASMIWLYSKVRSAFVICALCIKWTTTHKTCRLAAIPAALKAASASTCAAMRIDLRLGCGSMWHGNNQFSVLMKQDDLILKHFVRRGISGRSSSRAQTGKQWGLRGMTKVICHRLLARNASKWKYLLDWPDYWMRFMISVHSVSLRVKKCHEPILLCYTNTLYLINEMDYCTQASSNKRKKTSKSNP